MAAITRQTAKKFLADVPEQYVFFCSDGRILKNLGELHEALLTMADDVFACHSNEQKADFANWVKDIIGDSLLAGELQKARTRQEAAAGVSRRLAALKKAAK